MRENFLNKTKDIIVITVLGVYILISPFDFQAPPIENSQKGLERYSLFLRSNPTQGSKNIPLFQDIRDTDTSICLYLSTQILHSKTPSSLSIPNKSSHTT